MIATHEDSIGTPLSPLLSAMVGIVAGPTAVKASVMLDAAECIGWQDDGLGGGFMLWTLRKPFGKYPKGSTITQQTLEALLFPNGPEGLTAKYGSAKIVAEAADFNAVEGKQ